MHGNYPDEKDHVPCNGVHVYHQPWRPQAFAHPTVKKWN